MIKKIWHDPVWSKVIATGIITAVGGFAVYFLNLWPNIWGLLIASRDFAISSTSLPNWFIAFICLLSLPTLLVIFLLIWRKIYPNDYLEWQEYKTDELFGIRWRWSYNSEGDIIDLASFCPHCDFQIYADPVSTYNRFLRTNDQIRYFCDNCGKEIGEHEESVFYFENKIRRCIQLNIRNGKMEPDVSEAK